MTKELWAPALGYEGIYELSNMGRQRRLGGSVLCPKTRILHPTVMKGTGYVLAYFTQNNKIHGMALGRAVYQAFHGAIAKKMQVHHKDGNRQNNKLTNLVALTADEHGKQHVHRRPKGEQIWTAKLTEAQVLEIRKLYKPRTRGDFSANAFARKYNMGRGALNALLAGKTWKHLL